MGKIPLLLAEFLAELDQLSEANEKLKFILSLSEELPSFAEDERRRRRRFRVALPMSISFQSIAREKCISVAQRMLRFRKDFSLFLSSVVQDLLQKKF